MFAVGGCSPFAARSDAPNSHCADLVALAVTSYFKVIGSGHCVIYDDGSSPADADLADFTAEPPPVFDHIDHSCGYHASDHTFNYLVSNANDGAGGRIIVLVDQSGWVLGVAKHLDREARSSAPLACPGPAYAYSFAGW